MVQMTKTEALEKYGMCKMLCQTPEEREFVQQFGFQIGLRWHFEPFYILKYLKSPFFFYCKDLGFIRQTKNFEKFMESSKQLVTVDELRTIEIVDDEEEEISPSYAYGYKKGYRKGYADASCDITYNDTPIIYE